jgi:dihydropteroate synthase
MDCAGRTLDLRNPNIMGVLNITPDSFSDGGELWSNHRPNRDRIVQRAQRMVADGATVLDVGGESTRPGAQPVSAQEEIDRVLPVIEWLTIELDAVLSVDTSNPVLMQHAVHAGAGMINDVRALTAPGAIAAAAALTVPVVLMHMQGTPDTMQQAPHYGDVCAEVCTALRDRVNACEQAGIARNRIIVDPGFGFGKTLAHNLSLLKHLSTLAAMGLPVLAGLSRKSMIGAITGRPVDQRLAGSVALALLAAQNGARLLRVHDVAETADALTLWTAMKEAD